MKQRHLMTLKVVCEPDFGYANSNHSDFPKIAERVAENIVRDITRHIDNITRVTVERSHCDFCSACKGRWTEDSDQYNGGCCEEDEKNNSQGNSP